MSRRRAFLDISIDSNPIGRIVLELYQKEAPKTVENFVQLCTNCYSGTLFHRVVKGFMIQSGDFINRDGTGGKSIYGPCFEDENLSMNHDSPFVLSMANKGPNTNASQFFITTAPAPHLDGKHVIFGRVIQGQEIVQEIESVNVNQDDVPLTEIKIIHAGELIRVSKSKLKPKSDTEEDVEADEIPEKSSKKKKSKKKKSHKKKSQESEEDDDNEALDRIMRNESLKEEEEEEEDSDPEFPEIQVPDFNEPKSFLERGGRTFHSIDRNDRNIQKDTDGRKIKGRGFTKYKTNFDDYRAERRDGGYSRDREYTRDRYDSSRRRSRSRSPNRRRYSRSRSPRPRPRRSE